MDIGNCKCLIASKEYESDRKIINYKNYVKKLQNLIIYLKEKKKIVKLKKQKKKKQKREKIIKMKKFQKIKMNIIKEYNIVI